MKCRKRRLPDEIAAKLALESAKRRSGWKRQEVRFYLCPICKGYHLTSQEQRT